ncbi:methyltransferase domain-containing protein [Lentzea cavernae]|uniref:Methyltransferase domain-containing protein n=1 Tax=Lentzea cavernae TaxID=2020703 RepID=A0ABQ3MR03_9PSEU|nr:methyltransferase domain-containing protein [Lentzea cavernae]GHH48741.1 hypothetical protein GCM10017774_55030 [Lentzea cavernae]
MSAELGEVRETWEHLGSTDPYWAVLTEREHAGGDARALFFESGRHEVQSVADFLARHGKSIGDVAVDFGCGVGRLSIALAERCKEVSGVDVAASMLEEARANNPHGDRVRFIHNDASTLPFEDDTVDFVLSLITLQHIPPRLSLRYLLEMIRIVRPGGHLVFQLPSHLPMPTPIAEEFCHAEIAVVSSPATAGPGESQYVELSVRNTSDGVWPYGQLLNAANHWRRDGEVVRHDDGRVTVPALQPGESTTLSLRVMTPSAPGEYELELDLVQEHVAWWEQLGNQTVRVPLTVTGTAVAAAAEVVAEAGADEEATAEAEPVAPAKPESNKTMQMHGVHTDLVRGLFDQLGCTVLEAVPDQRAGETWVSYLYLVEVGEYEMKLRS